MYREKERKEATRKAMLRIAELQIKTHNLKDTPEEYVKKCMQKTEKLISTCSRV